MTMDTLIKDFRYALRVLTNKPVFTAIVVMTLAIGIGANTAIFSVVNSIILRPLPYGDPDRLTMIWMDNRRMKVDQDIHSYPNYVDYRDQNHVYESMAGYTGISINLTGVGEPERVLGAAATSSLFTVLKVDPLIGRVFTPDEEQQGNHQVVVLGHGLWQRRFGGDPGIIGQTINLSDVTRTVIGVMPPNFKFPHRDAEVYIPLAPGEQTRTSRGSFWLYAIGRLKPGVTLDQARADMSVIAANLEQQYREALENYGVNLVPLHQQVVGSVEVALWVLLGIVAAVLLIACANVANLLLARAAAREREIAIRTALGAGRWRIVRQLLTETVILGLLGGIAGLLFARWGLDALIAISPQDIPRLDQVVIDGRVLLFTLGVSLLTGLIFGMAPALQVSKPNLGESLKEGTRGLSSGIQSHKVRSALVVFEIAVSLVLLIGAGLMMRSFMRLQDVNLGFNTDRLLRLNLQLSVTRYPDGRQTVDFYNRLHERIASLPGVKGVGATTAIFIDELPNSANFTIEGRPPVPVAERVEAPIDSVSPSYFRTMGIPLLSGREFTEQDGPDSQRVVIINDTFARTFWPFQDPIGQRFKFGSAESQAPWLTIVGVVADMRRTGYEAAVRCETFLPYAQRPARFATLVVRTESDPMALAGTVRDVIWEMNPDQPISHMGTVTELLDDMIAHRRLNTVLFSIFAAVAVILAAIGVYGIMSHAVTQRTREIGIRMALGAQTGDVMVLMLKRGISLSALGVGFGLVGAWLLTRVMASLLYNVSATDPVTFGSVALLLVGIALIATYIPSRKASKVDPMVALRYE